MNENSSQNQLGYLADSNQGSNKNRNNDSVQKSISKHSPYREEIRRLEMSQKQKKKASMIQKYKKEEGLEDSYAGIYK